MTASVRAAPQALDDPFFSYQRPADYDSVARTADVHVPVHVPGGADSYIVCTLFRPAVGGVAVDGRFPGIVIDYQVYHLLNVVTEAQGGYDFFPEHGYNVAVCDPPGAGSSPGTVDQFGPISTQANYDLIEWFAAQAFSDGNIGQQGASYGGHTTNMVASYHPPHLKAIVPDSSFADWYEQTIYHGGIRNLSILYQPLAVGVTGIGGSNPLGGLIGNLDNTLIDYSAHPLYDQFWMDRSVMPRWDRFTVPALIVDGWNDRYKDGTTKNYMARKDNVWLLLGPWGHAAYDGSSAVGTLAPTAHQLAWYDHWLKHLPSAPLPRRKITSFEMPDDADSSGWQQFTDWPPPAVKTTRWYFTADRSLTAETSADSGKLAWVVNPLDVGSDPASGTAPGGVNQALADAAPYRLAFTSLPLAEDTVIAGATEVHLNVSFSATDGNLVARIMDVLPDGTVNQVATGWLKASHYRGNDHLETITPGTAYAMQVHIWPMHWRFLKGHSIRISLSSGDVPDAAPDAPLGMVNVAVGQNGSYVDLPTIAPKAAAADGSTEFGGESGGGSMPPWCLLLAAIARRVGQRRSCPEQLLRRLAASRRGADAAA
ncbi:CocE/NonD family hydrolase [Solimonas terrae]|uniref:CocE/NonD family hydrolase n=1 Tax=Solimonas terrae TaxID=1396819 RepID=A0A6M2BPH7_9GAMM|nr:CocE/NonD family hydrolase [Solimonas terrae]